MSELIMNKCVHCGHPGKVVEVNTMFYAQCTKCHKREMYQYVGITPKSVIRQWNAENPEVRAPKKPMQLTQDDFLYSHPLRSQYIYKINGRVYQTQSAVANALHTVSSTISTNFQRARADVMQYKGTRVERVLIKKPKSPLQKPK